MKTNDAQFCCLVSAIKSGNKSCANYHYGLTMTSSAATTDADIRSALHRQRLQHHKSRPGTLVIDELGLAHARGRVDVAVINGCIHGYEIKSARDNLDRLGNQLDVYKATLQRLTIVAACRHLPKVLTEAPDWCGLIEAEQGPRGGIQLHSIRAAKSNPDVDPVMLAHLLWRPEVIELLTRVGYTPKQVRRPRKQLYEMLCEVLTPRQITAAIREFMERRQAWRDHPAHA